DQHRPTATPGRGPVVPANGSTALPCACTADPQTSAAPLQSRATTGSPSVPPTGFEPVISCVKGHVGVDDARTRKALIAQDHGMYGPLHLDVAIACRHLR